MEELKKLKVIHTDGPPKKNGGARPGAGRKKKLVKYATQNEYFNAKVDEHFDELFEALVELSKGVTMGEIDEDGNIKTYRKSPDAVALKYLYDRRLGKTPETINQNVKGSLSLTELFLRAKDDSSRD